ncbi:MAG TPA: VOC family protein [Xanthomonadales bacterium]|nr:VOC family protein [Xanthomonadales bacterium]
MHLSRLAGFIIDCQDADLETAAAFWSAALGLPRAGQDGDAYERLDGSSRDLAIEVQRVSHPSRVHLDIETDDVDAEADRIEKLGAKRVQRYPNWWVMEAPTGQRFCIVRARKPLAGRPGTVDW